jgi:hypothetical protein
MNKVLNGAGNRLAVNRQLGQPSKPIYIDTSGFQNSFVIALAAFRKSGRISKHFHSTSLKTNYSRSEELQNNFFTTISSPSESADFI